MKFQVGHMYERTHNEPAYAYANDMLAGPIAVVTRGDVVVVLAAVITESLKVDVTVLFGSRVCLIPYCLPTDGRWRRLS